ncbi:MAG: 16S rRNA (guanine(527)-N(7))-methyltransferase RsmG [Hyphomicrobiales bacterium]
MNSVAGEWMPDEIANRFNVSRETTVRLQAYVSLLLHWQRKINLIGPATAEDVWNRHIADSLQLLPHIKEVAGGEKPVLVDLGAGAGLPGLPLAIALECFSHLVESNGKKAAFLQQAVRQCGVSGAVHQTRIENIDSDALHPTPNIISARALAPLEKLLTYAAPWLLNGCTGIFLKGQHVDNELTEATKYWNMDVHIAPSEVSSEGAIVVVKNLQPRRKPEE